MALASCSSDEVVQSNESANAIQFSVVANNASRASEYFCNNDKPKQFNVWAKLDEGDGMKTYFQNESYSLKDGESAWTIDGGIVRYWPKTGQDVHFYAARNHGSLTWNTTQPYVDAFTPADNADSQKDFVYAYTVKSRPAYSENGKVDMNFRHALSQIVFKAKRESSKIFVEIDGVKVCNVASKGKFLFPAEKITVGESKVSNVTDAPFESHTQAGAGKTLGLGTWTPIDFTKTYTSDFTNVPLTNLNEVYSLTDNTDVPATNVSPATVRDHKESMLLIPETTAEWDPAGGGATAEGPTGSYFLVSCKIRNIAGASVADDDVYLWGDKNNSAEIAIPFAANWEQGKKYIYTFVFTKTGHGGYVPGTGEETLIPIKLNITVDDFSDATNSDVNVD